MKKREEIEPAETFFTSRVEGEVAVLGFRENLMRHASDLRKRDAVYQYFDALGKNRDIKVVLLQSVLKDTACEVYKKFYLDAAVTWERNDIRRMCNVMNQFILYIINSDKIFIHVSSGTVISLFMNVSLACDYSIVSEDTVFCNPYLDMGLLPKGGGPFFLSRKLSIGKTYETLLLSREITAEKAVALGIADCIVPSDALTDKAMEIAHRFGELPASTLTGIKRLVNYSARDLENYLEYENQEIFRIVDSPEFLKEIGH